MRHPLPALAAGFFTLAALHAAPAGAKSLEWTAQEPVEPLASVAQLQSRTELLRRHAAVVPPDYTGDPDVRGRTFQQDAAEWLMTPATNAALEALRSKGKAQDSAHQKAALGATLTEATALVQQEVYRQDLLRNYWANQPRINSQRHLIEGLEARLPEAERSAQRPSVPPTLADAGRELSQALSAASPTPEEQKANADKVHAALDAAAPAYSEQRARLAKTVGDSERARGIAPVALARTEPCPPPATATSGKPQPAFAPDTHPSELDYPPTMRRLSIEGVAVVAATVSASGCAQKAEIYTSSGAEPLDQSALRWVLSAHFLPAEQDHKPVEALYRMGVRFRLED